jgi:hypothetical protein
MDEVDEVLARLADELDARDNRIAELEGRQPGHEQPGPPVGDGRPATDAPNEGRTATDAPNEV